MDPGLIDYVKDALYKGYPEDDIEINLVRYGYTPKDAKKALKEAKRQYKNDFSRMPKSYFILVGFIVLLFIAAAAYIYLNNDACGNGRIDDGETEDNCCIDVLCSGTDCAKCHQAGCGECEYLAGSTCVAFECCSDNDCSAAERCARNECQPVKCEDCQYADNHECLDFECCSPADCGGGESCIQHECLRDDMTAQMTGKKCDTDADCFDNNASTEDICMPRSKTCSNPVWECIGNDDYCPVHCSYPQDSDCERIDECDRNNDCKPDDACIVGECLGVPKQCVYTAISVCTSGDGCCPSGCTSMSDSDC